MKKINEKPFRGVDKSLFPPSPSYGQVVCVNRYTYVYDGHDWQPVFYSPETYYAVLVDNMLTVNGDNELYIKAVYETLKVQMPSNRIELWEYKPVLIEHNEPVEETRMEEIDK